jgi:DNA-binding LacI/PurR family transcriptional regulator
MAELGRTRLIDVAAAASVSVSAASVALNGRPGVSDQTRARIQKVARKLGYIPDAAAASLRSGRSSLVAFVSEATAHPSLPALAAHACEQGCLLVLALPAAVGYLEARGVDAAVIAGSDKAASTWARSGRPLVVLGPGRLPRGAVRVDGADATTLAQQTFAALLA